MRQHKVFYGSSYDRGLQHLLELWPKVIEKYPDAELHICYGWNLFDRAFSDNPERMAWKKRMQDMMKTKGITHYGRVGKGELRAVRQKCGIWAYPTHFEEINCITALDAQEDGCVPVVINYAALKETVWSGARIEGDIYDPETKQKYLEALLDLMGDEKKWKEEQKKGKELAQNYLWERIAEKWEKHF